LGQQYQLGPGSGIGPFAKGMIISLTIAFFKHCNLKHKS
jgi:hypothetical protein